MTLKQRSVEDAVQLSALVVLLTITVGFQVAGVLGAMLAVPTVATARVVPVRWAKAASMDLDAVSVAPASPDGAAASVVEARPSETGHASDTANDEVGIFIRSG